MKPTSIDEELTSIEENPDNQHLFYTSEFKILLNQLRSNKILDKEDFEQLFINEEKIELNVGLLSKYTQLILANASDDAKLYLVATLHRLYFSRGHEGCGEEIKTLIVKITSTIKDSVMRKQALRNVRSILDEDPCAIELKTAVEDILKIDDPNFSWT